MVAVSDIPTAHSGPAAQETAPKRVGRLAWPVRFYLLAVILPVAVYVGPIYMTSLRLVLLVMFVPLIFQLLTGRAGRILITDVLFILYLFIAMGAFAIHHPESVLQHVGSAGIEFMGGYLIGRIYIRDRSQFLALGRAVAILAACTLPLALYEGQTNRPFVIDFLRQIPGIQTPAVVNNEARLGLWRSQVVFAHPIHYGLFCSVGFSLAFVALKGQISDVSRYAVSAVVGLCTFLALSSGAFLALLLQIMLIAWYSVFQKVQIRWKLLFGLFVLAYIGIALLSDRPPVRVFMSYATFNAHTAFWRGIINEWAWMNVIGNTVNNIPGSPWIGIGLNEWVRPDFVRSPSIDNFWMASTVRYGIPAMICLILGYAIAIWRIGRRDFNGDLVLERIRRAWVFSFAGLTFTLVTVHVWTAIYSFVFFMFGAGIWMLLTQPQTGEASEEDDASAPSASKAPRYTRFPSDSAANTETRKYRT